LIWIWTGHQGGSNEFNFIQESELVNKQHEPSQVVIIEESTIIIQPTVEPTSSDGWGNEEPTTVSH
jgi:hypothetical protein